MACEGTGLIDGVDCPACLSFGVVYAVSLEELQALRRKVLAEYPDAEVADWRPLPSGRDVA